MIAVNLVHTGTYISPFGPKKATSKLFTLYSSVKARNAYSRPVEPTEWRNGAYILFFSILNNSWCFRQCKRENVPTCNGPIVALLTVS